MDVFAHPPGPFHEGPGIKHKIVLDTNQMTTGEERKREKKSERMRERQRGKKKKEKKENTERDTEMILYIDRQK